MRGKRKDFGVATVRVGQWCKSSTSACSLVAQVGMHAISQISDASTTTALAPPLTNFGNALVMPVHVENNHPRKCLIGIKGSLRECVILQTKDCDCATTICTDMPVVYTERYTKTELYT